MRKAYEKVKDLYINEPLVQDLLETVMMSGGSAAYQALFTDMEADEIAQSTLIGAALGLGTRPLAGRAGKALGRRIDKKYPGAFDEYAKWVPVTRDGSAAVIKQARRGGMERDVVKTLKNMLEAKRNMAGGRDAGVAEAILSYYLRNRADNVVQGAYALASPMFMGGDDNEQEVLIQ